MVGRACSTVNAMREIVKAWDEKASFAGTSPDSWKRFGDLANAIDNAKTIAALAKLGGKARSEYEPTQLVADVANLFSCFSVGLLTRENAGKNPRVVALAASVHHSVVEVVEVLFLGARLRRLREATKKPPPHGDPAASFRPEAKRALAELGYLRKTQLYERTRR